MASTSATHFNSRPLPQSPDQGMPGQQPQYYNYQQPQQPPPARKPYPQLQQEPLPQPVQHPAQSQHRQTKSRSFSFRSDKSHKSSGSKEANVIETAADKESRRLQSKADPTFAMNEAEPSAVAARHEASLAPLRSIQHKDTFGNVIADPDKSNPTRNRWERPLDTIRSFEAAIDGGYKRKSIQRADTEPVGPWSRRSSYHPGSQPRFAQQSYYGSRPISMRPDTNWGPGTPGQVRNSYMEGQGGGYDPGYGGSGSYQPHPRRVSRLNSEPMYGQPVYPLPHKDRSYETVTSAAASGSSDQGGYHTDPTSSDNSSIERRSPAKRQEPVNDYGIGFSQSQSYQNQSFAVGLPQQNSHPLPPHPANGQHNLPAIPRKEPAVLRRPTQQQVQQQPAQARPEPPEKRKSWFSRRFSKGA